ncbi:hypothetical protein FOL46_000730, partial [Perkinsus olseni]
ILQFTNAGVVIGAAHSLILSWTSSMTSPLPSSRHHQPKRHSTSRGRLFARCPSPAMPSYDSWYGQAKRLEFDGDLKGAFSAFMEAIARGDRVDSSLKDVAGLLNMVGHVHAAVRFLEDHRGLASNVIGYENLLERLKMEADRADVLAASAKVTASSTHMPDNIIPTTLRITASEDGSSFSVTPYTCERLFPNPHKIRVIIYLNVSRTDCLVDFGTNSAARKALNVPKLVDHYVIEWATDVWQELCKRLAVRLHLDKEHHKPLPMSTDEGNGEDLEELSSRTRHNYMAAFKNLFETPTFQRGDSLIEEVLDTLTVVATRLPQIYEEVSNLRRVDPAEDPADTYTMTPKENGNTVHHSLSMGKGQGSAGTSSRNRGESTCDGGVTPTATMLMVDTPSCQPNTASTGHSTRGVPTPPHHHQTSSTPSPQPLSLTTLLPDQWPQAQHHDHQPSWSDTTQDFNQPGMLLSANAPVYYPQGPPMWTPPNSSAYPVMGYGIPPHGEGVITPPFPPLSTGHDVQQHLIQMAAANATMALRCAEVSAAAVHAVMNTSHHYPRHNQQQLPPLEATVPAGTEPSVPPCTPLNPRRLVFSTPDPRDHYPNTPSPIVDRSRFS